MADITAASNSDANLEQTTGLYGPYWSDEDTAVIIYHNSADDVAYARTTNGGASWSTGDFGAYNIEQCCAFYDGEVPGDSGTLVHVVFANSVGGDAAYYANINVSTGSASTPVSIYSVSYSGSSIDNRIAIGKTVSGNLIAAFVTGSENEAWKSTNGGSTWSSIASPFDDSTSADFILLYPASTADDNDIAAIYHDVSGNQLFCRMYDDSGNSWSSTSIATGISGDAQYRHWDASVRHSDGAILVAAHNSADTATDDINTWEVLPNSIASPAVTAKTDVVSNVSEAGFAGLFINQQNDDVYFVLTKGSSFRASTGIYYYKSSDDMGSWSSETKYSEDADDDIRVLSAGRTVGDSGGYFMPCWNNDDLTYIFSGTTNAISIAAASGLTGSVSSSLQGVSASASANQENTSTASSSLSGVSSSASGTQENTGTASSSLSGVSSQASGSQALSGSASSSLSGFSSAASAAQENSGIASPALSGISSSASGSLAANISGSASSSLSGISASSTGAQENTSSASSQLSGVSSSASASQELSGSGASSLQGVSSSASGSQELSGAVSSSLSGVSSTASGAQENIGAASSQLSGVSSSASGSALSGASASSTLSGISSTGSGSQENTGIASSSLSGVSTTGTGSATQDVTGTASSSLSGVSSSASASQEVSGVASSSLQGVSTSASGSVPQVVTGSISSAISGISSAASASQELSGIGSSNLSGISASGSGTVPQDVAGVGSSELSGISVSALGSITQAGTESKLLSGNYRWPNFRQSGPGGWIHKF